MFAGDMFVEVDNRDEMVLTLAAHKATRFSGAAISLTQMFLQFTFQSKALTTVLTFKLIISAVIREDMYVKDRLGFCLIIAMAALKTIAFMLLDM